MIGIVDGIEINNYPEYADNEPYIVATFLYRKGEII